MRRVHFVDVFSADPFLGNPVAVVLDAEGLSATDMQKIARWTNLSETTFVLPPTVQGADYLLRIFTPLRELPFAGHPTLGSAHAVLSVGWTRSHGRLTQECGAGSVVIIPSSDNGVAKYQLQLPTAVTSIVTPGIVAALIDILGCELDQSREPRVIDIGPKWLVAKISSIERLLAVTPALGALRSLEESLGITGVTVYAESPGGIEVRAFAPSQGVDEDPVCGSGNGAVAVFRRLTGELQRGERYTATQGQCVGRRGRVEIEIGAEGEIGVGGACVTTLTGSISG